MDSSLDNAILDVVKEVSPSAAFTMGFDDYAGKLFIPSRDNIDTSIRRISDLKLKAKKDIERKVLDSLETALLFDEPQPVLDDLVSAIFVHLVKDHGVNDRHMLSLLKDGTKAVEASRRRFSQRKVPVGVKVLALYRLGAVFGILDTVKGLSKNKGVRKACDELEASVKRFAEMFELVGFGKGEFPNVQRIFKTNGFSLGREKFYLHALRKGFDYHESPEELERKAIAWIDEELPRFRKVTADLAKKLGCKPVPEDVEKKINARMKLDSKKLIKTTLELRRVIQRFVNEDVHGINPKYTTTVLETPQYLTGTIPSGAAGFFDTFTKKPFQLFFQTTDPKRDPSKSVADLMSLLVHEEYGHCVHHSNSVMGFVGKVPTLQLLPATLLGGPISEGLSFNRELEFFEVSKKLENKGKLTKAERAYVRLMDRYGGLKLVNEELEFFTLGGRLVRFLRVIGDVRINTGKQGLIEFIDWAQKYTGIPRPRVYYQLFPAHEGFFPGYATNYAVMGQEIRDMQKKIRGDKNRVKFSTYLCSIGFPPRSIYRRMLKDYAKKLR